MKKDIDCQFLCKDCERYGLCNYYHGRKEKSYICKYFHLSNKLATLDKIRTEIENKALNSTKYVACGLYDAIEIIDKHIGGKS